jgi:soluble lytic murein transglycosylase-like protein
MREDGDRRHHERRSLDVHRAAERRRGERRMGGLLFTAAFTILASTSDAQIYTRRASNGVVEATNVPDEPDFRLTYPGKGTLIHSSSFRRVRYSGQYDRDILDASSAFGVSPDLVKAVIAVESEFDAFAVSSKGAQGLMQLMPFTARRFGVLNPFDARQNVFGGVQYLRVLLDLFSGDVSLATAGYNAGENAVLRYKGVPPYKETQGYVRKIQALLQGGEPAYYAPGPRVAMAAAAPKTPVTGFAPSGAIGVVRTSGPVVSSSRNKPPMKPRTYYKYTDENGTLHIAHVPPAEGVLYTMIRAFD